MEVVSTLSELDAKIAEHEQLLVYVSQPDCSVCHALKPQVEKMVTQFPTIETVSVDTFDVPDIAGAYSILTAPVVLFFIDGKEILRRARFVPIGELTYQLERLQEMR